MNDKTADVLAAAIFCDGADDVEATFADGSVQRFKLPPIGEVVDLDGVPVTITIGGRPSVCDSISIDLGGDSE